MKVAQYWNSYPGSKIEKVHLSKKHSIDNAAMDNAAMSCISQNRVREKGRRDNVGVSFHL